MSGREVFGEFNEVVLVVVQRHLIGQVRNKHPDLVKPYGRILYGESSRYLERYGREVYLVGCLKAGGLLKDVHGGEEAPGVASPPPAAS